MERAIVGRAHGATRAADGRRGASHRRRRATARNAVGAAFACSARHRRCRPVHAGAHHLVHHAALARDVLQVTGGGSPEKRLALWTKRNDAAVARAAQTLTEIWESDRFTMATLSVAVRAIRALVQGSSLPE